jgi:RecB family exonuclease
MIKQPGYERQLRLRFNARTSAERHAAGRADQADRDAKQGPVDAAEWSLYARYRRLLAELRAEDEAGFAAWASRRLARSPRFWSAGGDAGPIVFLDLEQLAPAQWRIVERSLGTQRPVHVTLAYESDAGLAEAYFATLALRARLLELGLIETAVEASPNRPEGLRAAERSLFRSSVGKSPAITNPDGLSIRGAPRDDGAARVVASEVRTLLERGVPPDEIFVLFRHWSEEAELAVETLRAWGIPAHADVPRPVRFEPAVSALRQAISIPLEDWDTERVVRLLRHGMIRPAWPGVEPLTLAAAASTIKASLVFRGREKLLAGLNVLRAKHSQDEAKQNRVGQSREVVDRLFAVLAPLDQPRPWAAQVGELRRVARDLGMTETVGRRLDPLWDALDDQTHLLGRLGRGNEVWPWAEFAVEIDAISFEALVPLPAVAPGSILVTTVDQAEGARARHVILAGLGEGTFPARAAVEPLLALQPGVEPDGRGRLEFAREMFRFLRVVGSADRELLLSYATTDQKGQELLRAGFLEDLLGLLSPHAREFCHFTYPRLHPALIDQPELAGAESDVRIHTVARASELEELVPLLRLAGDPAHRPALDGTAAALLAGQRRLRGTPFSEFEGMLKDGTAIREVGQMLGANYRFSPSQLETYLGCPFQFYSKYVLGLEPIDERDELDEDPTVRGSLIHDVLERLESMLQHAATGDDLDQLAASQIDQVLEQQLAVSTELDRGLWQIQRGRLNRALALYVHQREAYQQGGAGRFVPHRLEYVFGEDGSDHPELMIERGGQTFKLRGRIDRVDLAQMPAGASFRVIDYKSGSVPSSTQVKQGEMLQLPLYAMAVERLLFAGEGAGLHDVGYWSLRQDGFKSITFENWGLDQESLVAHVLALIDRLRRGVFVVQSRNPGCESYCEFRGVCRVRQVRQAEKRLELSLPVLSVPSRRGRTAGESPPAAAETDA